jgi:aryl-alcohol dehydrogenase-like predicted oxidoreductase
VADLRGWTPFVALQVEYSLIQRTPERDLMPMAKALDLAVTPWAPLAGGALTGKYLETSEEDKRLKEGSARLNERSVLITKECVAVAQELGVSPAQVAVRWTMQKNQVVIPIVGARKASQIDDSLGCLNFTIPDALMQRLNEVSKIEMGFPHDFLASDGVKDALFAGTFDKIDNHRK